MTNSKSATLAFAAGILVSAAAFATSAPAQAAGLSAPTNAVVQLGTANAKVTKVHRRAYRHSHRAYRGLKYAINPYKEYQDCHWQNRRFYDRHSGTYYWQRVKICY